MYVIILLSEVMRVSAMTPVRLYLSEVSEVHWVVYIVPFSEISFGFVRGIWIFIDSLIGSIVSLLASDSFFDIIGGHTFICMPDYLL